MSAFQLKLEGYESLMNLLKELPEEKMQAIEDEFEASSYEIVKLAKSRVISDRGFIANAISHKKLAKMKYEVVVPVKYAPYQEFGTKSRAKIPAELREFASQYQQKGGGTWKELLRNITEWVRRKGISGTYSVKTRKRTGKKADRYIEDLEVAYPIARSIVKKGIKAQPFLFPSFLEVKPKLIKNVTEILTK